MFKLRFNKDAIRESVEYYSSKEELELIVVLSSLVKDAILRNAYNISGAGQPDDYRLPKS